MAESAAILEAMLQSNKLDAFTIKLLHTLYFMLGDVAGMRRVAARIAAASPRGIPEFRFLPRCPAFAFVESGASIDAGRCGRGGAGTEGGDGWAIHAVAHAYEAANQPRAGIAWLKRRASAPAGVNNFAAHLDWHRALFHLALGNRRQALALYDPRVGAAA